MLELPECQTLKAQLRETILDKTIHQVYANTSPHGFAFYFGDPAGYPALLSQKTVKGVEAFGGQVEIIAEDVRITFNDGVNVRYYPQGEKLPEKHQLHVVFSDGASLICTVQMYGGMMAFPEGKNDNPYYHVAKEKPSPLGEGFDERYFDKMFKDSKKNLSAKAFLATEQRVPGLGNGVLQDILFRAGVHPKKKLDTLRDTDIDRLFHSVKDTLFEMTEKGGRDTEKDLFGHSGGYQTLLSKNTLGAPCKKCGEPILRQAYLGGNIYFCPGCQIAK